MFYFSLYSWHFIDVAKVYIPLQKEYRDDNKDPLKIYTNPDYFFELWRENLQKEMEKARHIRKEKKRKAAEKNKEIRFSIHLQSISSKREFCEFFSNLDFQTEAFRFFYQTSFKFQLD